MNLAVRVEYKNCNECPIEYCIRENDTRGIFVSINIHLTPKCSINKKGDTFKLCFWQSNKNLPIKIKYKKSLLKSVSYLLDNYKELEFEDCIKLTEIKQKCIVHNDST